MTARLASIGAFPFPVAQGSQIFARDQAVALAKAGARVTFFCYGTETGDSASEFPFRVVRAPRVLSPAGHRAGPSFAKPFADAALVATYVSAWRRERFDVALAHNGEAALVALAARPATGVPVVYVCHTLMGRELASYAPPGLAPGVDLVGRGLDRFIAARTDGSIALCEVAREAIASRARGPVEVIPPGLDPAPPPSDAEQSAACARFGLAPGRFALYAGNLDRYQELETLARAARRLPDGAVVVATHEASGSDLAPLRVLPVDDPRATRALTFAARVAVLPRRIPGGFPIKLLNYMEAGRAIVAREGVADGFEHGVSAELLAPNAPASAFAEAIGALLHDPRRAERLGRGGRALLEARHAWEEIARRTLRLAAAVHPRPS